MTALVESSAITPSAVIGSAATVRGRADRLMLCLEAARGADIRGLQARATNWTDLLALALCCTDGWVGPVIAPGISVLVDPPARRLDRDRCAGVHGPRDSSAREARLPPAMGSCGTIRGPLAGAVVGQPHLCVAVGERDGAVAVGHATAQWVCRAFVCRGALLRRSIGRARRARRCGSTRQARHQKPEAGGDAAE